MDAQRIEKIRDGLNCLRKHKRRTVVMPATLYVGAYEFRSMLYDISLGGVRMKLDLPLARGAEVKIRIKDKSKLDGAVVWHATGFLGLKFLDDADQIRGVLGELVAGLD